MTPAETAEIRTAILACRNAGEVANVFLDKIEAVERQRDRAWNAALDAVMEAVRLAPMYQLNELPTGAYLRQEAILVTIGALRR